MAILATAATILSGVRSLINETTASFWTDAEINAWVLEALEDIAHETHCLTTYKTYTIDADDIFDERELRFDTDFIAIDEGKIYYNDICCYPTTMKNLSHFDSKWRSREGTPSKYYIRGDMYGFDRQIAAGDTIKFYMIERAVEISASVAPFNGDHRLVNFRKLARDYAVSQCWDKKNEDGKAQRYMNKYDMGLMRMRDLLGIDLDGTSQMTPENSLSHFEVEGTWPPQ